MTWNGEVVPSAKAAVPEVCVGDDVGVGEQVAVVGEDHGGAGAGFDAAVAAGAGHVEGGHPRCEFCGDAGDDLGIGVEGAAFGFGGGWFGEGVEHLSTFRHGRGTIEQPPRRSSSPPPPRLRARTREQRAEGSDRPILVRSP